jgi:hypothetical protein
MDDLVKNLGALIGYGILAISGATGLAYWLFKLLSEKWLNAKFEQQLAAFKHEQQIELERLRFRISGLMDRTTKLYQYEFKVLPELWSRLVLAHGQVLSVVAAFQSYPDVDRMTQQQLDEFLSKTSLEEWEKDELRNASTKTDYYINAVTFDRIREARRVYIKFHSYLRRKGIFLRGEMKNDFGAFSDLLHGALIEHETNHRYKQHPSIRKQITKLSSDGEEMLAKLEACVQARLWDSQADAG